MAWKTSRCSTEGGHGPKKHCIAQKLFFGYTPVESNSTLNFVCVQGLNILLEPNVVDTTLVVPSTISVGTLYTCGRYMHFCSVSIYSIAEGVLHGSTIQRSCAVVLGQ